MEKEETILKRRCTENIEVSQYVKLSRFTNFFVREMTHLE